MMEHMTAVSLFSSGGLGDLALRRAGINILVSSEILADRHSVFEANFPGTVTLTGDIRTQVDLVYETTVTQLAGRRLDILYATPPCQGMSKNGRGKLLNAIRAGQKPEYDERNQLVIPAVQLAVQLQPQTVLFENVPEMASTLILGTDGEAIPILEYIARELGSEYVGGGEVVEFADFGVPQCRQRLITVFSREPRLRAWYNEFGSFIPPKTHSEKPTDGLKRWVTVRDVISDTPPLDAQTSQGSTSEIPFHRVPTLDELKYWWVKHTSEGRSAFDNQCVSCGYDRNPTHTAGKDYEGINRASRSTPLHCARCGEMLPRPSVERDGDRELMRGFTSAYKRMFYDKPAPALTRNLSYACSDNKLHPVQNRVLSLYEAFRLHTLDQYDYQWIRADGKTLSDKTIREIIGESIPPGGLQPIVDHLLAIKDGRARRVHPASPLFSLSSSA